MAGKQEYNQVCPVASTLDTIGNRWALLVLRELSLGPRRFKDIHAGLETASTDMVTSRLRELEATGLVERIEGRRYQITSTGRALAPVMRSMMVFALRTGLMDNSTASSFGPDPVRRVLGLLGLIARTSLLQPVDGTYQLLVDHLAVTITPDEAGYDLTEGRVDNPDGTITLTGETLLTLLFAGMKVADLPAESLVIDGPKTQAVVNHLSEALAAVHTEASKSLI